MSNDCKVNYAIGPLGKRALQVSMLSTLRLVISEQLVAISWNKVSELGQLWLTSRI